MVKLDVLADYSDADGNLIESPTTFSKNIDIVFKGKNNRMVVHPQARITKLRVKFDCDNGTLLIGPSKRKGFQMTIRVGQDSTVKIGADLTTTALALVSAVEGTTVSFGDDVMLATGNQFRADDGHPIFDVRTGKRTNPARDIIIGSHVWFCTQAAALGGAIVMDGSVIGYRGIVTRKIPNNCIAVGSPAKVVKRDIAWERPHLSNVAPPYKPNVSSVEKSEAFWNLTTEEARTSDEPVSEGFLAQILKALFFRKIR